MTDFDKFLTIKLYLEQSLSPLISDILWYEEVEIYQWDQLAKHYGINYNDLNGLSD